MLTIEEGRSARVRVVAVGPDGRIVEPLNAPLFSATAGALAVTPVGARAADVAGISAVPATLLVSATFGGVSCQARATVLPPPTTGTVQAWVFDEATHRPLSGAAVVLSTPGGAVIPQGDAGTVATGADGIAVLSLGSPAPTSVSVSVFHADFGYLTAAALPTSALRTLALPLRRSLSARAGGASVSFVDGGSFPLAFASISSPGSFTRFSPDSLVGPVVTRRVRLGTAIDQTIELGAGLFVPGIDPPALAIGGAGWCALPDGGPDEPRMLAGGCATRTRWGFAAAANVSDLSAALGPDVSLPTILPSLMPVVRKSSSFVVPGFTYSTFAPPRHGDGGVHWGHDAGQWQDLVQPVVNVPLSFEFTMRVPSLPASRSSRAGFVSGVVWTAVPREGLVMLGAGFGADRSPRDGVVDGAGVLDGGLLAVRSAPLHAGLEGMGDYQLALAAIIDDSDGGADRLGASSVLLGQTAGLRFDPAGQQPVVLGAAFPAYPEGISWNGGTRTLRSSSALALPLTRTVFSSEPHVTWEVLATNAALAQGLVLPPPPAAFADRTRTGPTRAELTVQTFSANTRTGAALDFRTLIELDGDDLDGLLTSMTAFAASPFGVPSLAFLAPTGAFASRLDPVRVNVGPSFRVGAQASDDGVVRLSFSTTTGQPISGCGPLIAVAAPGGVAAFTVPLSCPTGSAIRLRAELLDLSMQPLSPEVAVTATTQLF